MANLIDTKAKRDKLKPRREPYWARIAKGAFVGYRRLQDGGTWIAKFTNADGVRTIQALNLPDLVPQVIYDKAVDKAREWFLTVPSSRSLTVHTVGQACDEYVRLVRAGLAGKGKGGEGPANDLAARFKRLVQGDKLADVALPTLKKSDIEAWRSRIAEMPAALGGGASKAARRRSPATLNRDMTCLRAALNRALSDGYVANDRAWATALEAVDGADSRRTQYLSEAQRRRLIAHAADDAAAFLTGLSLLPLRPGALAHLKVGNFDARLGLLTVGRDKHGADRRIALPRSTAAFFAKQAKGADDGAPLLRRAGGERWDKDAWKDPIQDAAKAAKLPAGVTAMTLRHSTITDLVRGGLDSMLVASLSGTSVAMIEKHYYKLQNDRAKKALALLRV